MENGPLGGMILGNTDPVMRRALLVLLLVAAAATLAIASAVLLVTPTGRGWPPHPPRAATATMPMGVSFGETLSRSDQSRVDAALTDVVALHATWIRVDLSWATLQPTSPDSVDWSGLDRVMAGARKRGLHVLGVLAYTPAWARAPGCVTFTCPPADPAAFSRFAAAAVSRYPQDLLDAVEVWNEPNLVTSWSAPDPVAYGTLFAQVAAAVHRAQPGTRVLVGGLAANEERPGAIDAARFLAAACAAHRCAGADGVAYHPYTFPRSAFDDTAPPSAWQRMTAGTRTQPSLRTAMQGAGLGRLRLWLTEYGAPTVAGVPDPAEVSEPQQAQIIASGVRAAAASPRLVGGLFVYTLLDHGGTGTSEDHYGLLRADGTQKPAFAAFAEAVLRLARSGG